MPQCQTFGCAPIPNKNFQEPPLRLEPGSGTQVTGQLKAIFFLISLPISIHSAVQVESMVRGGLEPLEAPAQLNFYGNWGHFYIGLNRLRGPLKWWW